MMGLSLPAYHEIYGCPVRFQVRRHIATIPVI